MSLDTLPDYLHDVDRSERGDSLQIDFQTYRQLAHSALAIKEGVRRSYMAIYRVESGCALDIWSANKLLTIVIDTFANTLFLFVYTGLDSPDEPECILSVENSLAGWRELANLGRHALTTSI